MYPHQMVSLHRIVIPCWILKYLGRNVYYHETLCHAQETGLQLQGQRQA